ncbi:hypothetical protein [Oceanospirillum beijerinckii]|uniref:hypothetical protein n=1 Tax=Oceanospirillum beijerinckii TaxID=64976 RepID=UPI00040C3672|nr:hypothetical protein [Oceanospirillum beijerinckii]
MPESPTKVVLIVTVGRTDIQVLAKSAEDSPLHYPVPVGRDHQKYFNEQLQNNFSSSHSPPLESKGFEVLTNLKPSDMERYLEEFQQIDDRYINEDNKPSSLFFKFDECNELRLMGRLGKQFESQLCKPIQLIPAKLFPIIRQLKLKQKKIDTAIVFNTSRDKQNNNRHADAEPYAFGEVIARWLAHELQLEFASPDSRPELQPDNKAFFCNYLTGNMNAEGEEADYPVSRAGMERIDYILETVTQYYKKQKLSVEAFYSPGGGIPAFKPQVEAACRFYFDQVDHWITPDNESEFELKNDWQDAQRYPSPDMSYRARKQALQLIEEGNFEGAAVIAKPFLPAEKVTLADNNWANAVRTTALWFQGGRSLAELNQSLYEASTRIGVKGATAHILYFESEEEMPNTLWAAFKVEAALRQGNLQDAVRYTCDLRDIALYDLLGKKLAEGSFDTFHNSPDECSFNPIPLNEALTTLSEQLNVLSKDSDKEKQEASVYKPYTCSQLIKASQGRFKLETGTSYSFSKQSKKEFKGLTGGAPKDPKFNDRPILLDASALSDAGSIEAMFTHPLNCYEYALKAYSEKNKPKARDYRNIITHGYLSPKKSEDIEAHFTAETVGLWSAPNSETNTNSDSDSKMRFLNQKLVSDLYKRLDSNNELADLYNKLTNTLKEILTHSPICDAALVPPPEQSAKPTSE